MQKPFGAQSGSTVSKLVHAEGRHYKQLLFVLGLFYCRQKRFQIGKGLKIKNTNPVFYKALQDPLILLFYLLR